jgi:HAD superfamily hydrolase (TIGR01509 family)
VLVDSEPIAVRIDVEMLASLGIEITEQEVIERYVGRSPVVMDAMVEATVGPGLDPDWKAPWRRRFRQRYAAELMPVDGVLDALDRITVAVCVASGSSHESLRYKLGLTGLLERFGDGVFSAEDVARGKPEPDLFLYAAASIGVAPAACVVVEDSVYGVQAARAAGMRVLGYAGGGMTPAAVLADLGATVFCEMRELPGLIGTPSIR